MALMRLLVLYALVGLGIYGYFKRDEVMPMLNGAWHDIEETAEDLSREVGLSEEDDKDEAEEAKAEGDDKAEGNNKAEDPAPAVAEAKPQPAPTPEPVSEPKADAPAAAAAETPAAPVEAAPEAKPQPAPTPKPAAQDAPAPNAAPAPAQMTMREMSMARHPGAAPAPQAAPANQAAPARMEPPKRPEPRKLPEHHRRGPISEADLAPEVRDGWIAARLAFYEGDYEKAEAQYKSLAEANPDLPDVMGELGNLYYYQQQHDKAAEAYLETGMRALKSNQLGLASSLIGALQRLAPDMAAKLRKELQNHGR
ncbi:tol-pal system YbgF family protein [Magnetospira sp. QH-2]|uniref:tetratricopeptide repeat protein n=1 Tax=Magnetospira sp. (strain QH-2) TaxID=1288970 RepID=UPI0003E81495|nr:hypothetical protein [Magnetospira sp. QH-2]CCQ75179.1 membrane protein of unknown function [Magnetospira sp. QH-2]